MRYLLILWAALMLAACQTIPKEPKKVSKTKASVIRECSIKGRYNWDSSHPSLTRSLCKLSKRYGTIYVTSSCRTTKANRGAKNSYHLYRRGCKAADIYIKGVRGTTILRWWANNVGGGRGYYRKRNFVHVDTGPNRTWTW